MGQNLDIRKGVSLGIAFAFLLNTFGALPPAYAGSAQQGMLPLAQDYRLPAPGVMVHLSPEFNPPILKGIKVHPDNPFRFDFILDRGDSQLSNGELKNESRKLIKYFLASLTIPEKDLWVNLSPYEKDRIIPQSFGLTEMGRDLLAEDYMLKQITASLIYPEDEIGKKFWKRIYEEAEKKFGTTNIPVNTFNKVWIVPEKAVVYENAEAGTAYVVESKLKVMLEQDYLSLQKHEGISSVIQAQGKETNQLGSQIVREIVIPELTKEVNEDKNFSRLRQVYNSLILATWYKKKIKDSILEQVYADKNKVSGVNINDPQEKRKIYERYLQAFKKGVYNYIKEEQDPVTQQMVPRKYFSGGMNFAMNVTNLGAGKLQTIKDLARAIKYGDFAGALLKGIGLGTLLMASVGLISVEPPIPASHTPQTASSIASPQERKNGMERSRIYMNFVNSPIKSKDRILKIIDSETLITEIMGKRIDETFPLAFGQSLSEMTEHDFIDFQKFAQGFMDGSNNKGYYLKFLLDLIKNGRFAQFNHAVSEAGVSMDIFRNNFVHGVLYYNGESGFNNPIHQNMFQFSEIRQELKENHPLLFDDEGNRMGVNLPEIKRKIEELSSEKALEVFHGDPGVKLREKTELVRTLFLYALAQYYGEGRISEATYKDLRWKIIFQSRVLDAGATQYDGDASFFLNAYNNTKISPERMRQFIAHELRHNFLFQNGSNFFPNPALNEFLAEANDLHLSGVGTAAVGYEVNDDAGHLLANQQKSEIRDFFEHHIGAFDEDVYDQVLWDMDAQWRAGQMPKVVSDEIFHSEAHMENFVKLLVSNYLVKLQALSIKDSKRVLVRASPVSSVVAKLSNGTTIRRFYMTTGNLETVFQGILPAVSYTERISKLYGPSVKVPIARLSQDEVRRGIASVLNNSVIAEFIMRFGQFGTTLGRDVDFGEKLTLENDLYGSRLAYQQIRELQEFLDNTGLLGTEGSEEKVQTALIKLLREPVENLPQELVDEFKQKNNEHMEIFMQNLMRRILMENNIIPTGNAGNNLTVSQPKPTIVKGNILGRKAQRTYLSAKGLFQLYGGQFTFEKNVHNPEIQSLIKVVTNWGNAVPSADELKKHPQLQELVNFLSGHTVNFLNGKGEVDWPVFRDALPQMEKDWQSGKLPRAVVGEINVYGTHAPAFLAQWAATYLIAKGELNQARWDEGIKSLDTGGIQDQYKTVIVFQNGDELVYDTKDPQVNNDFKEKSKNARMVYSLVTVESLKDYFAKINARPKKVALLQKTLPMAQRQGINQAHLRYLFDGNEVPVPKPFADLELNGDQLTAAVVSSIRSFMQGEGRRNGGIDLTAANMNLQTQNSNGEIKFHLDPALLQKLQKATGFMPVIINIQPLNDLRKFLGIDATV